MPKTKTYRSAIWTYLRSCCYCRRLCLRCCESKVASRDLRSKQKVCFHFCADYRSFRCQCFTRSDLVAAGARYSRCRRKFGGRAPARFGLSSFHGGGTRRGARGISTGSAEPLAYGKQGWPTSSGSYFSHENPLSLLAAPLSFMAKHCQCRSLVLST